MFVQCPPRLFVPQQCCFHCTVSVLFLKRPKSYQSHPNKALTLTYHSLVRIIKVTPSLGVTLITVRNKKKYIGWMICKANIIILDTWEIRCYRATKLLFFMFKGQLLMLKMCEILSMSPQLTVRALTYKSNRLCFPKHITFSSAVY